MLKKHGRFFWLDIYVGGKRVRRSLKTGNKFEDLDRYKEIKDKLLAEHGGGDVRFADFAKKYLDWAWSSKPASADREEQEHRALNHDELQEILEAGRAIASKACSPLQKDFSDLILFAAHTGLRKSEILNVRWKDVKDDEISVLGKGSRRRTMPLNKVTQEILDPQARRGESVFDIPNRDRKDLFRRTVVQIAKRTGIEFGFHDLRHYFTTPPIEKGVDLVTISAL